MISTVTSSLMVVREKGFAVLGETGQLVMCHGSPRARWAPLGALRPAPRWRRICLRWRPICLRDLGGVCCGLFPAGFVCLRGFAAAWARHVAAPVLSSVGFTLPPCGSWCPFPRPRIPRTAHPHAQACPGEPWCGGWRSGCRAPFCAPGDRASPQLHVISTSTNFLARKT